MRLQQIFMELPADGELDLKVWTPRWQMPLKEAATISGIPFFFKQWGSKNIQFHSNMFDGDVWHQFPG